MRFTRRHGRRCETWRSIHALRQRSGATDVPRKEKAMMATIVNAKHDHGAASLIEPPNYCYLLLACDRGSTQRPTPADAEPQARAGAVRSRWAHPGRGSAERRVARDQISGCRD